MHPLTLENDQLRVQLWPTYGSKITSVIDKADKFDLLFSYPRELPTAPHYDVEYGEGWYAGWDECFPGVAKGPYPRHPYDGITIPDHGELWGIPTQIQPSSEGLHSRWHGIRFACALNRLLRLKHNSLVVEYELENLAPYEFRFVWALHSLMAMTLPVELAHHGDTQWRWSHATSGQTPQSPFTWPMVNETENLSCPANLPSGQGWKVFSQAPIDKPFTITYPTRGRSLTISYASDSGIAAYWGIWINNGGWAGHKHFAVEPTTGRFDQLAESVRDRSAARVPSLASVRWTVCWTLA